MNHELNCNLVAAADSGHFSTCIGLIEGGADPAYADWEALKAAARRSTPQKEECVKLFLSRNPPGRIVAEALLLGINSGVGRIVLDWARERGGAEMEMATLRRVLFKACCLAKCRNDYVAHALISEFCVPVNIGKNGGQLAYSEPLEAVVNSIWVETSPDAFIRLAHSLLDAGARVRWPSPMWSNLASTPNIPADLQVRLFSKIKKDWQRFDAAGNERSDYQKSVEALTGIFYSLVEQADHPERVIQIVEALGLSVDILRDVEVLVRDWTPAWGVNAATVRCLATVIRELDLRNVAAEQSVLSSAPRNRL